MQTIHFVTSYLTFYLKGEVRQDGNFINLKCPNTILTFIPLGHRNYNIAINQISSVDTSFYLIFKNLIIGIVVSIFGFSLFSDSFIAGLIVALIGINMILGSFQTKLNVLTTSGTVYFVSFIIFQKSLAEVCAMDIRNLISNRIDDTNVRTNTDRIVDAIKEK